MLSAEEEQQWQELSRHVEWAERFNLIVLFVEDALLADCFKQRLQQQLQGRVSAMQLVQPEQAETLTQDIFQALQQARVPHALAPIWLELHQHRSEIWDHARDNFFARFNERRDLIRRGFPRPFIILLPLAYKSRLREVAPDVWSVRGHTGELRPAQVAPSLRINHDRHTAAEPALPLSLDEQALASPEIREWQRVRGIAIADSELLLVADRAFDAAFDLGQWSLAEALAKQQISLSHNLIKQQGETAWTLRNLNVALEKLGDIERALGRYDEAYSAYTESLQIDRELHAQLGTTPRSIE